MKNKLWIFGDSLSTGYNPFLTENYLYPTEITWPYLLAKDLNLQLNNIAGVGDSNFQIRKKFYENFGDFKNGDFIVFQYTFKNRIKFEPGNIPIEHINYTNDIDSLIMDDYNVMWHDFYPKVIRWLKEKNINFIFWSTESNLPYFEIEDIDRIYYSQEAYWYKNDDETSELLWDNYYGFAKIIENK